MGELVSSEMGKARPAAMRSPLLQPASLGRLIRSLALAALMNLAAMVVLPGSPGQPAGVQAQSNLLEGVRRDPSRAKRLCQQLRELNQQGMSYTSKQVLRQIASQENLSLMDAEVLTTYVVGLHCPDVR
jgi:hypothetical protein